MRKIQVKLPCNKYEILIENGLIQDIGDKIANIYTGDKIAIITDTNVDKFYGDVVNNALEEKGYKTLKVVLPAGEKSKSIDSLMVLYNKLLDFNLNRGNLIIALGGGVIGDLTGFCASTLLRGIPFVQVPTSLLAQIDSSIGGKVAVDLPRGKNLVGSFYHPKAVFIDPNVLHTLDRKFLNDGLGEAIKYGLIKDRGLFETLSEINSYDELFENLEYIIYNCCDIKRGVVERDEKDTGERMLLNFGHTIGHAIEKIQNYEGYSHGEAVSIGMYCIAKRCEDMGFCPEGISESIKEVLVKFNLPYDIGDIDKDKIVEAIGVDKKNIGKSMNLILIKDIGESFIHKISREDIVNFI